MIARIAAGAAALSVAFVLFCAAGLMVIVSVLGGAGPTGPTGSQSPDGAPSAFVPPGPEALADIPGNYLDLYREAAPTECPGLSWAVLAGIGKVETNHGRLDAPGVSSGENSKGAAGPMQFLGPTFTEVVRRHPPPPGGASPPSRYNAHDAIFAAAAYLCDSGAPTRLRAGIFAYNHAEWYVDEVLDNASRYSRDDSPR